MPSFVTFSVPVFGIPSDGRVIAVSLSVTSRTPSVGGFALDFEPLTSNVFTIPCATCGDPSGSATKHSTP